MRRFVHALAVLLVCPAAAFADSDGYFCTGPGYVAFETRLSAFEARLSLPEAGKHQLHVVQFSSARGFLRLPPMPLEDFQVHAMTCRPSVVDLEGWTVGYSVDIAGPTRARVVTRQTAFDPQKAVFLRNLGHWAKEEVIDLESDREPGEFQLVIAQVMRVVTGGVEHHTVTQLIQRALRPGTPAIRSSLKLFEGVFVEPVH